MISEKTIRNENWSAAKYRLTEVLDNVPMTVEQRRQIDANMYDLEIVFDEANGN